MQSLQFDRSGDEDVVRFMAALSEPKRYNIVRLLAGRQPENFTYHDHGSLVSLSRFSTVGSMSKNGTPSPSTSAFTLAVTSAKG